MKKKYDAALYWDITKACNFDCPQCAGTRTRLTGQYAPEKVNIEALREFFRKYPGYTFKINFTGGEPLLVENIIDSLFEISKKHYIGLITNLVSPNVKELAERLDPSRFTYINTSAHFIELERRSLFKLFMDNVLMLRDKGFPLTISEVAYPFISDKVESYREIFRKKGLKLVFNAFRGIWNSREYPAAYTKEEIRLFDLKEIPEFRPDIFNRKGLFCNAGYNSVIILENGDAYPCYMLEMPENKLGNIYTDLKLNRGMTKCPSKFCTCPFPAFESDLYDKALTETKTGKIKILSNWITARIGGFSRGKF